VGEYQIGEYDIVNMTLRSQEGGIKNANRFYNSFSFEDIDTNNNENPDIINSDNGIFDVWLNLQTIFGNGSNKFGIANTGYKYMFKMECDASIEVNEIIDISKFDCFPFVINNNFVKFYGSNKFGKDINGKIIKGCIDGNITPMPVKNNVLKNKSATNEEGYSGDKKILNLEYEDYNGKVRVIVIELYYVRRASHMSYPLVDMDPGTGWGQIEIEKKEEDVVGKYVKKISPLNF